MKKLALVVVLCLGAAVTYGQARVELGIKAGANFSKVSSDADGIDYNSKTGFHGGIYGLIKIANIGIQPEILYSQQGSKFSIDGLQDDFNSDFVYLNFPIIAKLYLPAGLNFQLGPQFGALVSAESDGDDVKDELKNGDISAVIGAGWDAPFGLRLTARYLIGLNDIKDNPDAEIKNRMFQISLGYGLIKLGK